VSIYINFKVSLNTRRLLTTARAGTGGTFLIIWGINLAMTCENCRLVSFSSNLFQDSIVVLQYLNLKIALGLIKNKTRSREDFQNTLSTSALASRAASQIYYYSLFYFNAEPS
jgi:hypothetical protein